MSLFIDDIFRFGLIQPAYMDMSYDEYKEIIGKIKPILENSPVFDITNVCEYLYAVHGKEHWNIEDWPDMAPPFPSFWMEMHKPSRVNSEGKIQDTKLWPERWGFVFRTRENNGNGWDYLIELFVQGMAKMEGMGPCCEWSFHVEPDGRMLKYPDFHTVMTPESRHLGDEMMKMFDHMAWSAFLAICLLNSRNVEKIENESNAKLSKRYKERHGRELFKFYAINVSDISSRKDGSGSDKLPWHLRRGHWAEYGEKYGKGKLFGKHEGRFWIPATVVGDEEVGMVEKAYRINVK